MQPARRSREEPAPHGRYTERTGVGQLVIDAFQDSGHNGIVCLTGISSGRRDLCFDPAALNRSMVLENDVIFGSVNANRCLYEAAAEALAKADVAWLERLITRACLSRPGNTRSTAGRMT